MSAVVVENLTKRFGDIYALRNVSFSVEENTSFGILGPNGAGKTTLIRILSTLLKPTSGRVLIMGRDALRNSREVRRLLGVVSHKSFLYGELTAIENLRFYASLYGVEDEERLWNLLEFVGLEDRAYSQVRTFSRGMEQRLAIARALIHDPPILLLDEPTSGLDVQSRERVLALVRSLVEERRATVIITTHSLDEASMICERVAILSRGELRRIASPEELEKEFGSLDQAFRYLSGV